MPLKPISHSIAKSQLHGTRIAQLPSNVMRTGLVVSPAPRKLPVRDLEIKRNGISKAAIFKTNLAISISF